MINNKQINVGIGFATGRKNFQKILKTNIYNWKEGGMTENEDIRLNLLIAYDLKYSNTKATDYTNISDSLLELIDDTYFIGSSMIRRETKFLIKEGVINQEEADLFFSDGYAAKRNAVLYIAMKNKMDYLLFLDDDEYPMAVTKAGTNNRSTALWSGQYILNTHLEYIKDADITNGYHCGYISPIPYMEFNDKMSEDDFQCFIEAISNDIVNWDTLRSVMDNGGVTYADKDILAKNEVIEVEEINKSKFISGSNLCINLTKPERVSPFFNPPGARGEDTFLGTCLGERKVLRLPCYTFHDGFSTYNHLMDGVLPIKLKYITADSKKIVKRFYKACIGWIRYKPLLLYITDRENYDERIDEIRNKLDSSLPSVCAYFGNNKFMNISKELDKYHNNVQEHYEEFNKTQDIWAKISKFLSSN